MVIYNTNQKSKDYSNIKDVFRPGHADFTYWKKYGIRDYRGGGRSSARETAARVAAGAVAKLMLREVGIEIRSGIIEIAGIHAGSLDFDYVPSSEIYALDKSVEQAQKEAILEAKNRHDSVGGIARVNIRNLPIGLGEPLYYKLDALLADAMMGINAVKAVEIGDGMRRSARPTTTRSAAADLRATTPAAFSAASATAKRSTSTSISSRPPPSSWSSTPSPRRAKRSISPSRDATTPASRSAAPSSPKRWPPSSSPICCCSTWGGPWRGSEATTTADALPSARSRRLHHLYSLILLHHIFLLIPGSAPSPYY